MAKACDLNTLKVNMVEVWYATAHDRSCTGLYCAIHRRSLRGYGHGQPGCIDSLRDRGTAREKRCGPQHVVYSPNEIAVGVKLDGPGLALEQLALEQLAR